MTRYALEAVLLEPPNAEVDEPLQREVFEALLARESCGQQSATHENDG